MTAVVELRSNYSSLIEQGGWRYLKDEKPDEFTDIELLMRRSDTCHVHFRRAQWHKAYIGDADIFKIDGKNYFGQPYDIWRKS
jgi:hypothetical protein